MDNARSIRARSRREVLEVIHQGIDQRTRVIAGSGMGNHTRRLVYNGQILVFEDNIKRYVFRFDFGSRRRNQGDRYLVTGVD